MLSLKAFFCAFVLVSGAAANNWATYPKVPKTASINGFADPIKDLLPSCAANCADLSTGNTPCPYWDTGCLCVMPQWAGQVAKCIALSCSGADVVTATSLAYSLCSKVGANVWMMPESISIALSKAAENAVAKSVAASTTSKSSATSDSGRDASLQPTSGPGGSSSVLASASFANSLDLAQTMKSSNAGVHYPQPNPVNKFLALLLVPALALMA